jgi:uncharacterized peroxidase-related enzyme
VAIDRSPTLLDVVDNESLNSYIHSLTVNDSSGPWIETVPWAEATGTLKEAYDWQAATLGEPTEFTQLGSLNPDLTLLRLQLYKVVEATPSDLTPLERRLAAYIASRLNQTPHCASGLEFRLDDLAPTAPPGFLSAVRRDPEKVTSADPRLDAIAAYAAKLTLTPGAIVESDIQALRAAGLSDLDILDLNNIIAYYNYINRVANGLGLRTLIGADHARRAVPR